MTPVQMTELDKKVSLKISAMQSSAVSPPSAVVKQPRPPSKPPEVISAAAGQPRVDAAPKVQPGVFESSTGVSHVSHSHRPTPTPKAMQPEAKTPENHQSAPKKSRIWGVVKPPTLG